MKNLVVLTGAGMSAESGISTFRDAGGLWDQYPVEQVATPEGYAANPKLVIDFYNERRKQLLAVKPNRGHELVSEMEKFFNVTVITQNIDNLHERAGSSHIIHLHGELTKVTSSWQPNNPAYIKELKPEEYEIHLGDLAGDGSQFRPFIVWFGESVPMIETAIEYAETADIFLIIGTLLNVYPRDLKRIAVGGSLDVGDEVGVGVLSTYRPDGDVSGGGAFHRVNNGRDGDCTFRA